MNGDAQPIVGTEQDEKKIQSTRNLSESFKQDLKTSSNLGKYQTLRLKNPKYRGRADRLDLISHGLHNLAARLGTNSYSLCDLSSRGFSYAQHVPMQAGLTFPMMQNRLKPKLQPLLGKRLPFEIFFIGQETSKVAVSGWIRNYRFFFGLPIEAVEREIKKFLFRRGYSEIKDPHGFYAKGMSLVARSLQIKNAGKWDAHCLVGLNMSMVQFLEELGATEHFFEEFWLGYENRPLYVKIGVHLEDATHAQALMKLTGVVEKIQTEAAPLPEVVVASAAALGEEDIANPLLRNVHAQDQSKGKPNLGNPLLQKKVPALAPAVATVAAKPAEALQPQVAAPAKPALPAGKPKTKEELYVKANAAYRSGPLLLTTWKKLLGVYQLPQETPFPKPPRDEDRQLLDAELNNLRMEEVFEPSPGKVLRIIHLMVITLAGLLRQAGQTPPSQEAIYKQVQYVNSKVWEMALTKLGWNPGSL